MRHQLLFGLNKELTETEVAVNEGENPTEGKALAPCSIKKRLQSTGFSLLCAIKLLDLTLDLGRILAILIHPSTTHKTGL